MRYLVILLVLAISVNTVWAEDPISFADGNLEAVASGQ